MKQLIVLGCLLGLVAATPAVAEQPEQPDQPEVDQQAAMEAWTKASTPGEFHAFFAKKEGKWRIAGQMWIGPDAEPIPSENTGTAEMILGGRYLLETMKGTNLGMPFEGLGITGYDNITDMVTSVWYDNMGTVTSILTGPYEKPGEPLKLSGTLVDPFTKEEMKIRTVTTFISDDESLFEYFGSMMAGMPEMKLMELHYTRVE